MTKINILLNFLFLPGILWVGILSALSDIKTGKVKNSLIRKGFLYGLIIYLMLFIWTIARKYSGLLAIFWGNTYYLNFNYFFDLIINVSIALIVGIILWKLDFWAAADAKLFALLSFLVPLTAYSHDKMIYFPSFILLLNIYTICLFYLIFKGISKVRLKKTDFSDFYNKNKQKVIEFLKRIPEIFQVNPNRKAETSDPTAIPPQGARFSNGVNKILNFLNLILIYSIIFSVIFSFEFKINILNFSLSSQLLVYLGLFLIYQPMSKVLKKYQKINILIFPLLIIATFFIPNFWLRILSKTNPFIRFFSGFFVFIIIIRTAANLLSHQTETKKIKLGDLRPNMLLGEETINLLKQDKDFFRKELGQIYFDGLSSEQIEKIKNLLQNKNLEEVEICKTFPFAPFIFAGAIITLILQGSLFNWLTQFLR